MVLGTFPDIEKALDSKCKSAEVNQWIRSMIHNRHSADNRRTARRAKDHSDQKTLSACLPKGETSHSVDPTK